MTYDESPRGKAFEALQHLLSQVQVELGARAWDDEPFERRNRACELRGQIFDAVCAYAKAREEEAVIWMV